ncbi:hypothetical protein, conserved [Eimeria maxima]|uniref:Uncharacterized protein n=1 Tax=Eimeria maxima TaxID=5804 RepID=U6M9T6_EIMMA|nr:hypothetical protein, conserved [Eimeria maxima]CDJ58420.1 hypothetical protein, conserved [Eimeria maxima]
MATEGNNPAPVVRRSYDATRGSLYTADFFAPLRASKSQWNASIQMLHAQQQQQQQQVPDLFSSQRWRGNRDLYWQQQQVQELLQEERTQLLKDSVLMNRNSLLAAYTYEDFPQHRPQYTAGDAAKLASNAAPEAAEPGCITKLRAAEVGFNETFSPSSSNNFSTSNWNSSSNSNWNSSSNSNSNSSSSSCWGSSNTQVSVDRRRARLFSRMESLTSREVYAAVRCIADPEHPYTLEELAVVLPHNVKVRCCCNNNSNSSSSSSGEESVDEGMCYNCQLHELQQQQLQLQQQQQQHWRRKENLRNINWFVAACEGAASSSSSSINSNRGSLKDSEVWADVLDVLRCCA